MGRKSKTDHPGDNQWYALFGKDGKGGFSSLKVPVIDPLTGKTVNRGQMWLHTGRESNGCITVRSDNVRGEPGYPSSKAYNEIKRMLDSTRPLEYKPGDFFSGRLYVE